MPTLPIHYMRLLIHSHLSTLLIQAGPSHPFSSSNPCTLAILHLLPAPFSLHLPSLFRYPDLPCVRSVVEEFATKPMQTALYFCSGDVSPFEYRHYALNVSHYTHFTSPIRRYADIVVHRLLAAALHSPGADTVPLLGLFEQVLPSYPSPFHEPLLYFVRCMLLSQFAFKCEYPIFPYLAYTLF